MSPLSKPQLLLVGQPRAFEERLALLLPGVNVIATRDFAHAASFGTPERLDVVLFEAALLAAVLPPVLKSLATPQTVWAATLRGTERPNFREQYGLEVQRLFPDPIEPEHVARNLSTLLRIGMPSIGLEAHPKAAAQQTRHAELLQIFLSRSRSRVGTMLAAVASGQVEAMRQVLAMDAHRLVGTLGTFGYPAGTEPARRLEHLLSKEETLTAAELESITAAAQQILALLSDDEAQVLVPQQASGPSVCLLSPNDYLRMEFSSRAPEYGFRAVAPPLSGFAELIESSHRFDLTVFDFGDSLPDPGGPLKQVVEKVSSKVLAVCPPLTLQNRFELSRLPLDTVAEGPLSARRLADLVSRRLRAPMGTRILALDDDPVVLALLETELRPLGVELLATDSPSVFWQHLEALKPDLILLDIDMPHYDGFQVCRAIKTNPRFEDVAVIFLSSRQDLAIHQHALAIGADDYLEKTIATMDLKARVLARLRRMKARREEDSDPLTGLVGRQSASRTLEQMFSLASLKTLPVTLAVTNLDHLKAINDRYGRSAGDAVLRHFAQLLPHHLRSEDLSARWSGEEFVCGLFCWDKETAQTQFDALLEAFRAHSFLADDGTAFSCSFSTGLAQYPVDGATTESVYEAALRALSMAKLRGRGRTALATSAKKLSEPVDVVVIDDDHPLGEVLVHALEAQGWSTVWFQDVQEARQAMLSQAPYLRCKVMLLEKCLGLDDGLALVRELKEAHRLGATCILTCSGRMSDAEVQMGFDLGTFDHLSKPLSLPAVLRTVRRGLEHYRYHGFTADLTTGL